MHLPGFVHLLDNDKGEDLPHATGFRGILQCVKCFGAHDLVIPETPATFPDF